MERQQNSYVSFRTENMSQSAPDCKHYPNSSSDNEEIEALYENITKEVEHYFGTFNNYHGWLHCKSWKNIPGWTMYGENMAWVYEMRKAQD